MNSKTPRTDAVFAAAIDLPWGSVVEIPPGHPRSNPWDLARELELENSYLRAQRDACVQLIEQLTNSTASLPPLVID